MIILELLWKIIVCIYSVVFYLPVKLIVWLITARDCDHCVWKEGNECWRHGSGQRIIHTKCAHSILKKDFERGRRFWE